jgi:hypothetical protein
MKVILTVLVLNMLHCTSFRLRLNNNFKRNIIQLTGDMILCTCVGYNYNEVKCYSLMCFLESIELWLN